MGVLIRETFRGSIFQYLGVIIGGLNVAFLFPTYLGETNWGILSIIVSIITISSQFTLLGSNSIVLKYFPRFKKDKLQKGFVKFTFQLFFVGVASFTAFFYLFNNKLLSNYEGSWTNSPGVALNIILLLVFLSLFKLISSYINIVLKTSLSLLLREFLIRALQAIFVFFYVYYDFSFNFFIFLYTSSYIIVSIIGLIFLIKNGHITISHLFERSKKLEIKEYLSYGGYTLLAGFGTSFVTNIDILMIGALLLNGEELAGKYRTAIYFAVLITIPLRPLFKIMQSLVSNWWKENKKEKIVTIYNQSVKMGLLTSSILLLLLIINISWLTDYIFKSIQHSFYILLFFGIGQLITVTTGINSSIINLSQYYKFSTYSVIALVFINGVLDYFFIIHFGVVGAAIGTCISLSIFYSTKMLYVFQKFGFNPINKEVFSILLIVSGLLILTSIFYDSGLLNMAFSLSYSAAIGIALLVYLIKSKIIQKAKMLLLKK